MTRRDMAIHGTVPGAEPPVAHQTGIGLAWMATPGRPCANPDDRDLWTSEDHKERATAARLCRGCPVIEECGRYAAENRERHGVWGGRQHFDSHRPVTRKRPPATAETSAEELISNSLSGNNLYFKTLTDAQKRVVIQGALSRGYTWSRLAQALRILTPVLIGLHGGRENYLDDRVRELHAAGKSDPSIATELAVSVRTVRFTRQRLGLPPLFGPGNKPIDRTSPTERREQIAALKATIRTLHPQGLSDTAIAQQLGQPIHRIRDARMSLGLPANAGRGRPRKQVAS